MEDTVRLQRLLLAAGVDPVGMAPITLEGEPYSKSRPRFRVMGSGRKRFVQTYALPADVTAEKVTAAGLRAWIGAPATGNIAVAAIFFRSSRQPVDVDNLLKHVCDAANGVVWHDDKQATAVLGIIELDAECPRTALMFAPHRTTMLRGTDAVGICPACGGSRELDRKFCSHACANIGRRKDFVPYAETSHEEWAGTGEHPPGAHVLLERA